MMKLNLSWSNCSLVVLLLIVVQIEAKPAENTAKLVFGSDSILNYSLVFTGDLHKDVLWCQSPLYSEPHVNNIGTWYDPKNNPINNTNGSTYPLQTSTVHSEFESKIGLSIDSGVPEESLIEGLYTCIIQDDGNVNRKLVAGIYRSNFYDYNDYDESEKLIFKNFSLLTAGSIDTVPPVFMFTFMASNLPPAHVQCSVNNVTLPIEKINRKIIRSVSPIMVEIQVTFRTRKEGLYECTVTDSPVDGENDSEIIQLKNLTVTSCPFNLTAHKTSPSNITLTWSAPLGDEHVKGYEVFYIQQDGKKESIMLNGYTNTHTSLTGLVEDTEYTVYVVAFGGDLPSIPSNSVSITTKYEFEVCAQQITSCENEAIQYIKYIFALVITNVIRGKCRCNVTKIDFITDSILDCNNSTALFKVNIKSLSSLAANEILLILDQWVANTTTISTGISDIKISRQCHTTNNSVASNNHSDEVIICSNATITSITTVTPDPAVPIMRDDSNTSFVVVCVLMSLTTVLMVISLIAVVIVTMKYIRLKSSLAVNETYHHTFNKSVSNFEMMECDAYRSCEELDVSHNDQKESCNSAAVLKLMKTFPNTNDDGEHIYDIVK